MKDKKVRNHCHLTGKYRGPAHEDCNLSYRDSYMVPVIFHNLSGYDGYMIVRALAEVDGKIDILPVKKEKNVFLLLSISIIILSISDLLIAVDFELVG